MIGWRGALAAIALLALAATLRLAALDAGWIGVDQARDLAWAERIASGEELPRAGPLMRNRFHLGATYYFFWALPALVAPGPAAAYAFAAGLGVAAVAGAGWLALRIAGPAAGLAALAWMATDPVAVLDARIAWAPAALPLAAALLLLVARAHLARPGRGKAAAIALVAGFATQLHLAAAALLPVAAGALLARLRAIGARGLAFAALCGALPLVPMALAWPLPVPRAAAAASAVSPYADRFGDFLALGARWLEGLSPAAPARPAWVNAWLFVEAAIGWVPLAAGALALAVSARVLQPAGLRLVVGALATCIAVPLALPIDVWGYYLDAALVPAAVVVGVAATRPRVRLLGGALLAAIVAGRALLLLWWLSSAAGQGFVAANLDYLRVGGARPAAPDARARLLGIGVKQRAADVLLRDIGIAPERLWRDAHGPGFGDLDTDNGYVLRRAAARAGAARAPDGHALVLYAGEVDPLWVDALAPPLRAGPLEIFALAPRLRLDEASLGGCASGPLPGRAPPHPLEYGSGEPSLPAWPCDRPRVTIPFAAATDGVVARVFPRVVGAGRVVAMDAGAGAVAARATAPGLGDGVVLGSGAGELRLELAIDGPADLDVVELHGRGAR